MKSFDEMADDFVAKQTTNVPSSLLTVERIQDEYDGRLLREGYLAGVLAGIKSCTDALEPIKEEGGL